jgi:Bacterial Ig-like domain (group 3)
VTFAADGTRLATVALPSCHATFATSALTVGTHSMTAAYGGDANDNPSTSAALSEVINAVSGGTAYYFAVNGSDANDCTGNGVSNYRSRSGHHLCTWVVH